MRFLLLLCGVAMLHGAEPVVELTLPDLGATWRQLEAGALGRALGHPESEILVEEAAEHIADLLGPDWQEQLRQLGALRLVLLSTELGPVLRAELRGSPTVLELLAELVQGLLGLPLEQGEGWLRLSLDGEALPPSPELAADTLLHLELPGGMESLFAMLPGGGSAIDARPSALSLHAPASGLQWRYRGPTPLAARPIDRALLDGLPVDTVSVYVQGLRGAALAPYLEQLTTMAPVPIIGMVDAWLQERAQIDVVGFLSEWDGSFLLASRRYQGLWPIISLPATPALSRLLQSLEVELPQEGSWRWLAPRLGERRITTGFAVLLHQDQWWLASDPLWLEDLVAGRDGGWSSRGPGAALVARSAHDADSLGWGEGGGLLRLLNSVLSVGLSQMQDRDLARAVRRLLLELRRASGPVSLHVSAADGRHVVLEDPLVGFGAYEAMGGSLATIGIAAGIAVPGIVAAQRRAEQSSVRSDLRQLLTGMIAYQFDHDGQWPRDLPSMIEELMLPSSYLDRRVLPDGSSALLYVRPVVNAHPLQPIILHDPAADPEGHLHLVHASGSLTSLRGQAAQQVWNLARELALRPEAAAAGVAWQDWQAVWGFLE